MGNLGTIRIEPFGLRGFARPTDDFVVRLAADQDIENTSFANLRPSIGVDLGHEWRSRADRAVFTKLQCWESNETPSAEKRGLESGC